jgi:glucose-6-phosphate 1-epimerase
MLVRPGEDRLELELEVKIGPEAPLQFTAALHTYLAVDDVTKVELRGAEGLVTREAGRPDGRQSGPLRFGSEVDRQLLGLQQPLELYGPRGQALLRLEQSGFPDAVVWNIGPEKAPALSDLGPDEWRRYLCVEAALTNAPLLLQPGSTWRGLQRLVLP